MKKAAPKMKKAVTKMKKKSAMPLKKKSAMPKALVGKQKNLPKELRDKILAAPAKMLKPAAMKLMSPDKRKPIRETTRPDKRRKMTPGLKAKLSKIAKGGKAKD